ncbi:hypothetical protein L1987_24264 [Smallanthus sonchifolius]|uniref:Uncharacterized protein n=1 Tax=Smallanthus sonchifolius TaxID=185202 RepID=A0ACB9ILG2_9ASTR|nr:hypothetical protein L1987_24264 [Smallanthus sonchifolius]
MFLLVFLEAADRCHGHVFPLLYMPFFFYMYFFWGFWFYSQMCILLRGLQQCRFTLKKASPWMIGGFPKLEIGLDVIG